MRDIPYNEVIEVNLTRELRKKVTGQVIVEVNSDTLLVCIYNQNHNLNYRCTIRHLYSKIAHGITSAQIAEQVLRNYKYEILSSFFR